MRYIFEELARVGSASSHNLNPNLYHNPTPDPNQILVMKDLTVYGTPTQILTLTNP